jgi:hypothetical protein
MAPEGGDVRDALFSRAGLAVTFGTNKRSATAAERNLEPRASIIDHKRRTPESAVIGRICRHSQLMMSNHMIDSRGK